ncbi:MAG: hypothetical protein WHT06_15795 [Desulfobacterales bacterium]
MGGRTPLGELRAASRRDARRQEATLERLGLEGGGFRLALARPALLRRTPDGRLRLEGLEAEGSPGRILLDGVCAPEGTFEARLRLGEGRL